MIALSLALAAASTTSASDKPLTCALTNGAFALEKFDISVEQNGGIRFRPLEGAWSSSITGGKFIFVFHGATRAVLVARGKVFEVNFDRDEQVPDRFRIKIGEARAGLNGSVTIAAGLCKTNMAATSVLRLLPAQGDLPPAQATIPSPPLMMSGPLWGMSCALTDADGQRRDISLILDRVGYLTKFRFYNAAWIGRKIGTVSLLTLFASRQGAGFGGKPRLGGLLYASPSERSQNVGVYWNFDYFNEGGAEPEIDLMMFVPEKTGGQLVAGMCKWTDNKEIESGTQM